jgi:hypothetical protein
MSKQAFGIRHLAFSQETGMAAGTGFCRERDADWKGLSARRSQREPAVAQRRVPNAECHLLAECRMPRLECRFSPHIARSCTVTLNDTSVTNLGLADSVLIGVGKLLLERGSGRGLLGGCNLVKPAPLLL